MVLRRRTCALCGSPIPFQTVLSFLRTPLPSPRFCIPGPCEWDSTQSKIKFLRHTHLLPLIASKIDWWPSTSLDTLCETVTAKHLVLWCCKLSKKCAINQCIQEDCKRFHRGMLRLVLSDASAQSGSKQVGGGVFRDPHQRNTGMKEGCMKSRNGWECESHKPSRCDSINFELCDTPRPFLFLLPVLYVWLRSGSFSGSCVRSPFHERSSNSLASGCIPGPPPSKVWDAQRHLTAAVCLHCSSREHELEKQDL